MYAVFECKYVCTHVLTFDVQWRYHLNKFIIIIMYNHWPLQRSSCEYRPYQWLAIGRVRWGSTIRSTHVSTVLISANVFIQKVLKHHLGTNDFYVIMISNNQNFVYFFCFKYIYESIKMFNNMTSEGVNFFFTKCNINI